MLLIKKEFSNRPGDEKNTIDAYILLIEKICGHKSTSASPEDTEKEEINKLEGKPAKNQNTTQDD